MCKIISADALVPDKEKGITSSNGYIKRNVNSFLGHCSFSYNMRYYLIGTWTWDGYKLFSTISLCVYLLQGPPDQFLLATVIIPLEVFPQFLLVNMNYIHWDGPYRRIAMDFFNTIVDIPLSVWYLSFYPNDKTKYIVVCKILIDSVQQICHAYGDFIETYLYFEKETNDNGGQEIKKKNGFDNRYLNQNSMIEFSKFYD